MPWEVAISMDDATRGGCSVILSEFEHPGERFDWNRMEFVQA